LVSLNKKYLPILEIGDVVEVNGVVGEVKGERRIAVKKKDDLRVLRPGIAPEVVKREIASVISDDMGTLLMVEGEIVEKKANTLFIDDGTDEIQVAFPRGLKIKEKTMQVGDIMRVAGIVRTKNEELLLMPRDKEDIQKITNATTTSSEYVDNPQEKKYRQLYVGIAIIGMGILGFLFLLKKRGKL
jgi:DNA/RNA endonuclease YhcR with UshA esterase domain